MLIVACETLPNAEVVAAFVLKASRKHHVEYPNEAD